MIGNTNSKSRSTLDPVVSNITRVLPATGASSTLVARVRTIPGGYLPSVA
jgi:hypothetical protein